MGRGKRWTESGLGAKGSRVKICGVNRGGEKIGRSIERNGDNTLG